MRSLIANGPTRLTRLSVQFSDSVDEGATANSNASKTIQDSLGEIDKHFGLDSLLIKRLALAERLHQALVTRIQSVDPKLSIICDSFNSLCDREDKLTTGLEEFTKKLAETQIPTGNPVLELEISKKFDQNTQLQVQVHNLSTEVDSLQKQLQDSGSSAEKYRESHEETQTALQAREMQIAQLQTENLALQGDIEITKIEMKERLDKTSLDLQEMQNEQEMKLMNLQKEKEEIEEASTDLIKKMGDIQHALLEAKEVIDEQRREREVFARENEDQISELTKFNDDAKTQMLAQREEVQRFQELDAASRVENSSLREKLEQAQEKILGFERVQVFEPDIKEPKSPEGQTIVPFAVMKEKISSPAVDSPFHDSCDFAMLFMSDEEAEKSNPFGDNTACSENKNVKSTQKTSAGVNRGASKNPIAKRKRKVSISDAPVVFKSIEEDPDTQDGGAEENNAMENTTSKVSKHIHKWTYSRVHSTATQLQRQQPTGPARTTVERRLSPKGLVSASSAVDAPKRTNSRGRGKGRSRSKSGRRLGAEPLSF